MNTAKDSCWRGFAVRRKAARRKARREGVLRKGLRKGAVNLLRKFGGESSYRRVLMRCCYRRLQAGCIVRCFSSSALCGGSVCQVFFCVVVFFYAVSFVWWRSISGAFANPRVFSLVLFVRWRFSLMFSIYCCFLFGSDAWLRFSPWAVFSPSLSLSLSCLFLRGGGVCMMFLSGVVVSVVLFSLLSFCVVVFSPQSFWCHVRRARYLYLAKLKSQEPWNDGFCLPSYGQGTVRSREVWYRVRYGSGGVRFRRSTVHGRVWLDIGTVQ